ncbi:S-layer homology domain-containing protein [Paenibacillus elgii]|uniref:S-layer homology domain-containing protein n=1 Tax=Paenibacillus elgii TaxID=189691 RepID=UPI000248D2A3|nr:S-layer homology domain-containing protein [Paenibacillus elgii]
MFDYIRCNNKVTAWMVIICMILAMIQPFSVKVYADSASGQTPVTKWLTFKYDNFNNPNQTNLLSMNGQASAFFDNTPQVNNKVLRLTKTTAGVFGSAFNKSLIYSTNNFSFSTSFAFRISEPSGYPNDTFPDGADGFTFAIQTKSSNAGSVGDGIGYGGIQPSFAVKFDTFDNKTYTGQHNDPSDNYVGLAQNGNVANTNPTWYKAIPKNQMDMKDGNIHYAWIDYDGINKTMRVYTNNTNNRSTAVQQIDASGIDLGAIFAGKSSVYAGFTSATGSSWENHDILSWYFTNQLDPIDVNQPDIVYKQAPTTVMLNTTPTGEPGKMSVTATVYDVDGNPVSDAPITVSSTQGTFTDANGNPVSTLTSDNQGQGQAILDFGGGTVAGNITAVAVGGAYVTVSIPAPPTGLKTGATAQTASTLSWNPVPGASYYKVYKNGVLYASNVTGPAFNVSGLAQGTFDTFAVTVVKNGLESVFSNRVTLPVFAGLSLDSVSYTLPVGETHQTVVSYVYSDGYRMDVTPYASYQSMNSRVATVNAGGLVTATGAGTTVIQAVYGSGSAQTEVIVTLGAPTGVSISDVTSTGATLTWNAVPGAQTYNIYENGRLIASGVTGTTYTATGLTAGTEHRFTVTAVSNGIESSASGGSNVTTSTLRELQADQSSFTLAAGDTHQTKIQAVYLDESIQDVTGKAVYQSSDPSIATVDSHGVITAKAPGTATITISYDGKTLTETIVVQSASPQIKLTLNTSPSSVVGDGKSQVTLSANVVMLNGLPVAGKPVVFHFGNGGQGDVTAVTDASGVASVTFTAPDIRSTTPVREVITASATDPMTGLTVQKGIDIRYMPASIKGILIDQVTGQPIAGAAVSVSADFNQDGITDFSSTVTTGPDGSYQISVPRGNYDYMVDITTSVKMGNQTVQLTKKQTVHVDQLNGTGETIVSSNKISGQLFVSNRSSSNTQPTVESVFGKGNVSVLVKATNGSAFVTQMPLDSNGSFDISDVPQGQYVVSYQIKAKDGTMLAGPSALVKVSQNGETGVVYSLIDPYGVVKDTATGQPISGVTMNLYWADTELNKQKGRTPNTLVQLPELPDFAPNQNHNPQVTNQAGEYAWMVFPDGDYYITATKSDYSSYSSLEAKPNVPAVNGADSYVRDGIIHVGQDLVSLSFSMSAISSPSSSSGPSYGGVSVSPSVTASDVTSTGVTLNWNGFGGASSYNIYDNGKLIASGVTSTSYKVTGLAKGDHPFTIKAVVNGVETGVVQSLTVTIPSGAGTDGAAGASDDSSKQSGEHEKYVEGYPDGTFKPERNVTRQEVAAMLYRLYHLSKSDSPDAIYSDLTSADWGAAEVAAVTKAGYMNGYPDGTFKPNQPITREEMAGIVARLKHLQGGEKDVFADIADSWARGEINAAGQAGILSGYPDGTFRPKANTIRAEVVTIFNRLQNRGPLTGVDTPSWSDVPSSHWAYGDVEEASTNHGYRIENKTEKRTSTK